MPRPSFANDNFYHVYNRGVDKRTVFLNDKDYHRFMCGLHEFNDDDASVNFYRRATPASIPSVGHPMSNRGGKKLVDIVCFCLMPNHFHLLLMQREKNGVSKFMQKLGNGYTKYFNTKRQRSGVLFQGKFKAAHVQNDTYLTHLSRYIHLNPLEIIEPEWKEKGIKNWGKASDFLNKYRWSSYNDYVGKQFYPSIVTNSFILDYFDRDNSNYAYFVKNWAAPEANNLADIIIE